MTCQLVYGSNTCYFVEFVVSAQVMSRTDLHEAVENGDVEGVDLVLQRSTDGVSGDAYRRLFQLTMACCFQKFVS